VDPYWKQHMSVQQTSVYQWVLPDLYTFELFSWQHMTKPIPAI
jgi:hypothetical protein